MTTVAVFDSKPYDREHLLRENQDGLTWRFLDWRLTRETATTARDAEAVCVFVNDQLDRPCLEALAAQAPSRPTPAGISSAFVS